MKFYQEAENSIFVENLIMNKSFIEDKKFKGVNYTQKPIALANYENCTFADCVFASCDLSEISFTECRFENSDLSLVKLKNTAFKSCFFNSCKLLGLHFDDCNKFLLSMNFENCMLNLSTFFQLGLKNTHFLNCSLQEVDFAEADLTKAVFQNCDLSGAIFDQTNLEQADFRTSYGFTIDPENNRIKKARISLTGLPGLLTKYDLMID